MFFAVRDTFSLVKWCPDQHLLGVAGRNGRLFFYDPIRQIRVGVVGPENDAKTFDILSCCWLTNQLVALAGASGCVEIWDAHTKTLLRAYTEHSPEVKYLPPDSFPNRREVYAVACSPNGTYIASAGNDSHLRVWQATTGETCFIEGSDPLRAGHLLTWLADNLTLVSSAGNEVMMWDAFSGKILHRFRTILDYEYRGCQAVSPDGSKIAVATDDEVVIYDLPTGRSLLTYGPPGNSTGSSNPYFDERCSQIAWSPDGTRLATSFHQKPKRIVVWDAYNGQTVFQRTSHESIACLDWSFDSQILAWAGQGYLETLTLMKQPASPR